MHRAAIHMEQVDSIHSIMERNREKYDRSLDDIKRYSALYAARNAYPDLLIQIAQKTTSPTFWITDMDPLVGYDAVNTTLNVGPDGTDRHVLLDTRDTRAGSMVRSFEMTERAKAPQVTALLVSGYFYKKSKEDQGKQLQRLNELVASKFDERSADSLFLFDSKSVQNTGGHYFVVQDAEKSKGHNLIPEYADKFYMVMPLKKPLPVPGEMPVKK